jgi:hypothetical protein
MKTAFESFTATLNLNAGATPHNCTIECGILYFLDIFCTLQTPTRAQQHSVLCVGFHFSHTHTHTTLSGDLLFSLIHNNNDTVIICRAFYSTVLNHSISFIMIATRQDVYLFFLKDIHRKTAHKKQQLQRPLSCHWITNGSACTSNTNQKHHISKNTSVRFNQHICYTVELENYKNSYTNFGFALYLIKHILSPGNSFDGYRKTRNQRRESQNAVRTNSIVKTKYKYKRYNKNKILTRPSETCFRGHRIRDTGG